MKKVALIFLIILLGFSITAQTLVEETYYNAGQRKPVAKRFFEYDDYGNIQKIIENLADSDDIIEFNYTYDLQILRTVEEFRNKQRIKYAVFEYKNNQIQTKTEYNNENEIMLIRYYHFEDGILVSISEEQEDRTYLGARKFFYSHENCTAETLEDENGKIIIRRAHHIKNNRIEKTEFFMRDRLIREVIRKYTHTKEQSNQFGYPLNFWDIR